MALRNDHMCLKHLYVCLDMHFNVKHIVGFTFHDVL